MDTILVIVGVVVSVAIIATWIDIETQRLKSNREEKDNA